MVSVEQDLTYRDNEGTGWHVKPGSFVAPDDGSHPKMKFLGTLSERTGWVLDLDGTELATPLIFDQGDVILLPASSEEDEMTRSARMVKRKEFERGWSLV